MIEFGQLTKEKKDKIIKEFMKQDEEMDFMEYARKRDMFFTSDDIEYWERFSKRLKELRILYIKEKEEEKQKIEKEFEEIKKRRERLEKMRTEVKESPKTAAKRIKLSEMTDEQLKEYYRKQKEEKERRKRIQEEIKAEEERKRKELYIQEQAKREERYREWEREHKEELIKKEKSNINEEYAGLIGIALIFGFMFVFATNFESITSIIVCGGLSAFWIVICYIADKDNIEHSKREKERLEKL